MKQQKFFVIVITVCALLLSLAGCASSSAFDGSSAKNADSYHLDVKIMNGTDTHTLELKQGDTLKILFETVKGSLEMKITSPDGTSLYQGDGTVTEFTVEAPVDGPYAIVSNKILSVSPCFSSRVWVSVPFMVLTPKW